MCLVFSYRTLGAFLTYEYIFIQSILGSINRCISDIDCGNWWGDNTWNNRRYCLPRSMKFSSNGTDIERGDRTYSIRLSGKPFPLIGSRQRCQIDKLIETDPSVHGVRCKNTESHYASKYATPPNDGLRQASSWMINCVYWILQKN